MYSDVVQLLVDFNVAEARSEICGYVPTLQANLVGT